MALEAVEFRRKKITGRREEAQVEAKVLHLAGALPHGRGVSRADQHQLGQAPGSPLGARAWTSGPGSNRKSRCRKSRLPFRQSIPDTRRGLVGLHGQAPHVHRLGRTLRPQTAVRGERPGTHLSVQGSWNFQRNPVPAAVQGHLAIGLAHSALPGALRHGAGEFPDVSSACASVLWPREQSPRPRLRSCWKSRLTN